MTYTSFQTLSQSTLTNMVQNKAPRHFAMLMARYGPFWGVGLTHQWSEIRRSTQPGPAPTKVTDTGGSSSSYPPGTGEV